MNRCLLLLLALVVIAPGFAQERQKRKGGRFDAEGPKAGEKAPDFALKAIDGATVRGAELWAKKPALIITGSYTCPVFRDRVPELERVRREFGDKLNYLVLYTTEAHPDADTSPYSNRVWVTPKNEKEGILVRQPKTMAERVEVAQKCAAALKLEVPVAVDGMDDATWKAYGSAPNCACLVDANGKVVLRQGWFDGDEMAAAVRGLIEGKTAR